MFDWDDDNVNHIAKHRVEPWEVEEAMTDANRLRDSAYNYRGEQRFGLIGATEAGRILYVVYCRRLGKFRPVTARDANKAQTRLYQKGK